MGLDLYSKVEPYLEFHDEVKKLHELFIDIVGEINPKTLLDLGCGRGDLLEQLSKNIKVKGIDLSSEQIKVCKEKGLDASTTNMYDLDEKFKAITATFDVLNYIAKDELNKFVKKVYESIESGGYFIFDVNSKFAFEEIVTGSIVFDKDGKFITIDALYDEPALTTTITLFSKQKDEQYKKEQDKIVQYYHSKELLKKVIKKSGFEIEAVNEYFLYDYDMADKLIYICKKA